MAGNADTDYVAESTSDRNTIRGNWSHKLDFLLSLVGYNVGLGNILRFPYLCYRNGGGAFLIPYFTMLLISGLPLFFLELCIGQYVSLGPIAVWEMCPPLKGVGIAAVTITGLFNLYFNTLMAYILFYLFASMTSELPWTTCDHSWNTPACSVRETLSNKGDATNNLTYGRGEVSTWPPLNSNIVTTTLSGVLNSSSSLGNITKWKSPSEEYFQRYVLNLSPGLEDLGNIQWRLMLCLLLAWVVIFCCVIKGIKTTGKVVYFTAVFPYVVLLIMLGRGLTLPGAIDGVLFYVVPKWEKLLDPKVWGDAASQIFYSLGPAWGGIITFASYNKFHANCMRDAIFSSCMCCGTSVFAGFAIFSIVGFMAHELNVPISDVVASGPGLAFVVYPEALSRMAAAPFWSIIFFAMLFCVGLDTMFATVELVIVSVIEELPRRFQQKSRMAVSLAICVFYFLLGLPQVTQGGMYVLNLIDWYIATFSILIVGILEVIIVVYIYGYSNFAHNVKVMMGFKPNIFFRICWFVLTPGVLLFICVSNAINFVPATYDGYDYPDWADVLGWLLGISPLLGVPGYMIYYCSRNKPPVGTTFRALFRPRPEYGPMMPKHRLAAGLELNNMELKRTSYPGDELSDDDEAATSLQ